MVNALESVLNKTTLYDFMQGVNGIFDSLANSIIVITFVKIPEHPALGTNKAPKFLSLKWSFYTGIYVPKKCFSLIYWVHKN
jgi:hypothetical protein